MKQIRSHRILNHSSTQQSKPWALAPAVVITSTFKTYDEYSRVGHSSSADGKAILHCLPQVLDGARPESLTSVYWDAVATITLFLKTSLGTFTKSQWALFHSAKEYQYSAPPFYTWEVKMRSSQHLPLPKHSDINANTPFFYSLSVSPTQNKPIFVMCTFPSLWE